MAGSGTSVEILPIDQAVAAWRDEAAPLGVTTLDPDVWAGFPAQDNANSFATFLARIRETNDYCAATPAMKAATQQRVATMLTQLQSDPALREDCFNLAFEATESCGDRVALRLLDMEMQCLVSKTNAEITTGKHDTDPQPLIDLCKGQYRLQVLTNLAKEKVATMNFCDEIELHLGYLVQLSSTYALPTRVSTMLYPVCSGLAAEDIAAAKLKLGNDGVSDQAANANNLAYVSFLAASPLMRSLLERQCGPEMAAVDTATHEKIESEKERIADDLDKLEADSPGYQEKSKQLMEQHGQLETTIPAEFTRPVLLKFLAQREISASL
ncbi:secreted effector protein [Oxalobacteraceae bacterium IMCC9480]|nr:secreted effector protein [Oxalobacteraceae bacterium IMCC9480]